MRRLTLLGCFVAMSICAGTEDLWPAFVGASTVAMGLVLLSSAREHPSVKEVVLLAVLFRLVLLPLLPSLSDDGFRYVWDAMLLADGINPYLYVPSDAFLASYHNLAIYSLLNSPDYFSVYPPLSQIVFFFSSWASPHDWVLGLIIIKVIVTSAEVCGVLLLSTLVDTRKLVLYAWNPLVIVEIAGQGHGEGIVAALLITTIWAIKRNRLKTAVAAITGAVWVKLIPVLLVPFVLRRTGWRFAWIPVLLSAAVAIPFMAPSVVGNVWSSLELYVRLFEFNAGPYLFLKWLGYEVGLGRFESTMGLVLGLIFLTGVIVVFVKDRTQNSDLSNVMAIVLGGFLALATTVHPWYLVPILALVPFMASGAVAWLWLGVTSTGTYLFYSHGLYWPFVWAGWAVATLVGAWIWIPKSKRFNALVGRALRKRAVEKAAWIRPFLPEMMETCEVLDLGAGEGYVGEILQETVGFKVPDSTFEIPGCRVILCDVRDANRTGLPYEVYDGDRLPFDNQSFDVTLLVFVLHHAKSARRVVEEAKRVSRRRVIIVESVYEGFLNHVFLRLADRLANRIRSGGEMSDQEGHLHFRTVDEWITLVERDGGVLQSIRRWGKFHKQALFVIDCEVSGPRREFVVQSVGNN